MASLNKVILIGNLGADPELRSTQSGAQVASFRIATSDRWKDKVTGQPQERTEWHRITVWGRQAETCAEHLHKGRSVYVEGRLQTREWEDKTGAKRWTTEVNASQVLFLGGRGEAGPRPGAQQGGGGYGGQQAAAPASDLGFGEEDFPF